MIATATTYLVEQVTLGSRVACIGAFHDEAVANILAQRCNRLRTASLDLGPGMEDPHLELVDVVRACGGVLTASLCGEHVIAVTGEFQVRAVKHVALPGHTH